MVRRILVSFIIGAMLAYISAPLVERIESRLPLPRVAAVGIFFAITLLPLAVIGLIVAPTLVQETAGLVARSRTLLTNVIIQLLGGEEVNLLGNDVEADMIASQIIDSLGAFLGQPGEAIHVVALVLEIILDIVLSLVMMFYFLVDRERFGRALLLLFPEHVRPDVQKAAGKVHIALGHYLRGLLFLVVLMSTVTWVGMTFLFHLPFSLAIAIATGFLETIPLLGPILAGAIAATVGLEYGGVSMAIWIIVYYYIVRQAEDQFVAPYVLGRAVQLHPVLAIFAVLAGGTLAGVLGMILAIPVAATVRVVMDHWQLLD